MTDQSLPYKGYFSIPCSWISKDLERVDENVVVVSIFGQSSLNSNGFKSSSIEWMYGSNIFKRDLVQEIEIDQKIMTGVEGYYNAEERLVFLHLRGPLDISVLVHSLTTLDQEVQEKGFLSVWADLQFNYARTLLLLFCTSHLMLLCHPTHIFDISYIQLFRSLDSVRLKSQPDLTEILRNIPGVSKDWSVYGRFCPPRVLFIFSSRKIPKHILRSHPDSGRSNRVDRSSPLRKLALELEYQIYRLLRKCRVITNISATSLFAIPNNQPFVFVLDEMHENSRPHNLIGDVLWEICSGPDPLVSEFNNMFLGSPATGAINRNPQSPTINSNRRIDDSSSVTCLSDPFDANNLSDNLLIPVSTEKKRNIAHSFTQFLKQHLDLALSRGFDDNFVRHTGHVLFETPQMGTWFNAFHALFTFFTEESENKESRQYEIASILKSHTDTDICFSDHLCGKVIPYAISAYKEGLPKHYTRAQHEAKVQVALGVLSSQARGPMCLKYIEQLEEACLCIWKDGRVGCETLSLRGNTCQHPKHTTAKELDGSVPAMNHSSGVISIAYCNCGHTKGQVEDPFTIRTGNLDFYQKMSDVCCFRLESKAFPTFNPSVLDAKAADLQAKSDLETSLSDERAERTRYNSRHESPQSDMNTSQNLINLNNTMPAENLSQGDALDENETTEERDENEEGDAVFTVEKEDDSDEDGDTKEEESIDLTISRQASTTEYLPGMLTLVSPPGLLPLFSSWSLVCLGPSSLYSHNAGICEQPGFLAGTNFLLPWDVTIKIRDKSSWPAIADSMGKKGFMLKNKKNRMGGDLSEFNVKIFLGTEYQCVRGHRFMMATPDRPLKASSVGHVKDTAIRIAQSDMPLYYQCPCSRGVNILLGQLMRLHVVTPKAPVNVTLNPVVQPAPDPSPRFIPQPTTFPPIKLSASAYWILRLPYVYGDEGGSKFYPPSTRQGGSPTFAKLLKGCYGISEIALDR